MSDNKEIDPVLQVLAWVGIALLGVLLLIVGAIAVTIVYVIVKVITFLIKNQGEKEVTAKGFTKKAVAVVKREVASNEEYIRFREAVKQLVPATGAAAVMAVARFIDNDPHVDALLNQLPALRQAAIKAAAVAVTRVMFSS